MSLNSSSLNSCPKYRFLKNGKFISAFYKLSFVIYTNCKLKSKFSSDVHCKCLQSPFFLFFSLERNIRMSKSRNLRIISIYRIFRVYGFWRFCWPKGKRRRVSAKATHAHCDSFYKSRVSSCRALKQLKELAGLKSKLALITPL